MLPVVTFSVSALSRGATPWGPSVRRLDPRPVPAGCRPPPRWRANGPPGPLDSRKGVQSRGDLLVARVEREPCRRLQRRRLLLVHHLASDARRAPEGAPGEYLDPERLFNAVEMAEKRSDARPAKKIMVALPREFDARERFRALEDFISWNITANGYACTYAIHTDKDGRNPHAHILVANRRIDPKTGRWAAKSRSEFALDANGRRIPVIDPDTGRQKIGARNRKVWKRVNVSNNPLDSKEFLERLRREWADSCNALLPGYAVIDHRSFKARGIERIPTIHEGYASREMEKRGGRGDLCEENRRIQALNRLLDALRAMIGRLSDQAQGILTAVKRRQRPSGAPQAPSSPEPAERPQERPQARETPPQAPQEPPKPIRTKKALTDRFKTRLDERLAENERKQAEKQAEPDMEETWDLSDPADPLNIGMGWGTGGHGLGL